MEGETISKPAVCIGIITYGALTAPYVSLFREALAKQSFQNFQLLVHDNTDHNVGFGAGYNELIRRAKALGARYFCIINPDLILKPDALEILVAALEHDPQLASVAPKLLRWDFTSNVFSNTIDSCGITLKSGLGFADIGQGEEDSGQYDQTAIFGPSGAAGLYRISALDAIAENGAYFDEHFFMYKEDCDFVYRLMLAGFKSRLIPLAIGYHDRTAVGGALLSRFRNRRSRSRLVNQWSFTNQHFIFIKYWRGQSAYNKFLVMCRICVMALNALVFEQYLLSSYKTILATAPDLRHY